MPALGVVGSKWIEPLDLAQTGTYTIKIDPQSFAKGSQTLTAWTFHGDQTANTSANGSTHTFNLATPGQNGSLYVSASNGDRLSFTFTGVSDVTRQDVDQEPRRYGARAHADALRAAAPWSSRSSSTRPATTTSS